MKYFLVCFLLLPFGILLGQLPGYAGKKTVLSVEVFGYPAVGNYLNYRKVPGFDNGIGLNARGSIQIERIISRTTSIGVAVGTFHTNAFYPYELPNNKEAIGKLTLNATPIHGFVRLYDLKNFGSLAPMGVYHQIDIFIIPYNIRDITGKLAPANIENPLHYTDLGTAYTLGIQRVFAGSFTYDVGLQVGLPLDLVSSKFGLSESTTLDDMHSRGAARVLFHYLFNIKAGIGWVF